MAGKTQPPARAAIWDEIEPFWPKSTPMRQPGVSNPLGPPKEDPLAFRPMSIKDHLDLARAPKKRRGETDVVLWSYDILSEKLKGATGVGLPGFVTAFTPDHMYVEYDDGADRLIARGGPSAGGFGFARGALDGSLRVKAAVVPADRSIDNRKGMVVASGYLPGVTAQGASIRGQLVANDLARTPRRYGPGSNSNTYAAEVTDPLFPGRPRHPDAWGASTRLRDAPLTRR